MRRRTIKAALLYLLFIILALTLSWWIAGEYYKPYPPATPTINYWPTRIAATPAQPVATATHSTPIQPTIGYTETLPSPTATVTSTPAPPTYTPTTTPIPVMYRINNDKEPRCVTYFIRPWGIKKIGRCWLYQRVREPTPTPTICIDCGYSTTKTPQFKVDIITGTQ